MSDLWTDARERALNYAALRQVKLRNVLGGGYDGIVYATTRDSAIQSLRYAELYLRERDVYMRLKEHAIESIAGCHVPRIVDFDDDLWVVEMEIVVPPFVLDFASARLDAPIQYPDEVLIEWEQEKHEQYGENWGRAKAVLAEFRGLGIFLSDVKPGNIQFD